VPQHTTCKFNHTHVILVGKHDPVILKELLATKVMKVFLHDTDEFNQENDQVFGKGEA